MVNGRTVSGPTAGEPFWQARLNEGHRLTAVGGSDDHGGATCEGAAIGTPTTVIHAQALTEAALLAGIRAGHVDIKTRGPRGPDIRFSAPDLEAAMGDVVRLDAPAATARFRLRAIRASGQRVHVIRNGTVLADLVAAPLASNDQTVDFLLSVSAGDWVRINLVDEDGITAIANPIYFRGS